MPDVPTPSPAQAGMIDELEATVIGWDDGPTNVIVQKPDGEVLQLTPDGELLPGAEEPEVLTPGIDDVSDAEDFKPPEIELAVDSIEPRDVVRAMDRNDEVQILDELMGRAIASMVYSFEQAGKPLTDLSYNGVNECVRLLNERGGTRIGISPQPPIIERVEHGGEVFHQVMVYAVDARTGAGRWGQATEPEMMKLKSGGTKWDKFAIPKALSKAQRNALRAHIPEEFRQKVIALAVQDGNVKKLKPLGAGNLPGGKPLEELSPPVVGPDADRIRAEIKEAYDELVDGFGQLVLPPARYHLLFEAAQRDSVDALERFKGFMENVLQEQIDKAAEAAGEGGS